MCVREPRQDLTLRALAQLNKLATLPLPVCTELILQLGHAKTHILYCPRLELSSCRANKEILDSHTDYIQKSTES